MEKPIRVIAKEHKYEIYAKELEEWINRPEVLEEIEKETVRRLGSFLMWGPNGRPDNNNRQASE